MGVALDLGQEQIGLGRRHQMIAVADEQFDPRTLFEVAHEPADGWLADLQLERRAGDGTAQHDKAKGFELAWVEQCGVSSRATGGAQHNISAI